MRLRGDLITEYKHLQREKAVAPKELLSLAGRGATRRNYKKSTTEELKGGKTAIKNSLECGDSGKLAPEGLVCYVWFHLWNEREVEQVSKSLLNCFFRRRHLQNRRKSLNYAKTGRCWRWAGFPSCRERFTHFGRGVFTELVTFKLPVVNGKKQTLFVTYSLPVVACIWLGYSCLVTVPRYAPYLFISLSPFLFNLHN